MTFTNRWSESQVKQIAKDFSDVMPRLTYLTGALRKAVLNDQVLFAVLARDGSVEVLEIEKLCLAVTKQVEARYCAGYFE